MKVLLDTDVCIWAMRGKDPYLTRMRQCQPEELAVAAMTVSELEYGALKSEHYEREWARPILLLDSGVVVLPFDLAAARTHARLRHALRGQPIGSADMVIASVAVARGLPVATANVREFGRVPGLRVEDWSRIV